MLPEEVVLCRKKSTEVGCHYYIAEAQANPMLETGEQLFEDSSLQQGNLDEDE